MYNVGLFKILLEKYESIGTRTRTVKKYIYLDSFTYSKNIEYIEQYRKFLKRYGNINHLVALEFNFKLGAYETFTSGKNRLLLYPLKGAVQKGDIKHDYIN